MEEISQRDPDGGVSPVFSRDQAQDFFTLTGAKFPADYFCQIIELTLPPENHLCRQPPNFYLEAKLLFNLTSNGFILSFPFFYLPAGENVVDLA